MKKGEMDLKSLSRREFLYLSGAGIAGMTMGGFPKLSHGQGKKYGGRIRIGGRYAASGLDCHKNQDYADYKWYSLMFEGLTEQGPLPQVYIKPLLAKSWEVLKGGREFIFPLRQGIKFHNGKEMDSGDVKYSFDRVMDPKTRSPMAFALKWVDSITVTDKYTIKITMKEPYAPFLANLTVQNCAIIPKDSQPTGIKPAPGTGPFVFKEFHPNETLEVTRFGNYHFIDEKTGDRLPRADAVWLKKMPDETVRLAALRAGDVDFIETPPLNKIAEELKNPTPGITINYDMPGNNAIWFNVSKPPFNNKKLRHAIAYAINKKELQDGALWGLGQPLNNQPFPNDSRFYIPVQDREQNIAKAKQLLAEAGYPQGLKIELFQFQYTIYMATAQVLLDQLRKIGIEGTIKVVDRAPYWKMMRTGEYGITCGGISERFDWDDAYYSSFHSGEIGTNNWTRYKNPEIDKLVAQGRSTWDMEERRKIYKKVVEILMEDLPVIYTIDSVVGYGFRNDLKGFVPGFGTRTAFDGGGVKYWWIEKS